MRIATLAIVAGGLLLALSAAQPARAGSASLACQLLKARVAAASAADRAAREREFRASCEAKPAAPRRRTEPPVQHRHQRRIRPQPAPMAVDNSTSPTSGDPPAPTTDNPNTTPCCSQSTHRREYSSLDDAIANGGGRNILLKGDMPLGGPLHIGKSVTIYGEADASGRLPVISGQIIVDSGFVFFKDVVLQQSGASAALIVNGGTVSLVDTQMPGYAEGATVVEGDSTPSLLVLGGEVSITGGGVGEHAMVGIKLAGGSLSVRGARLDGGNMAIHAVGGVLTVGRSSLSSMTGTSIFASGQATVHASGNTFTASTGAYPVIFAASVRGSLEDNIFKLKGTSVWLCVSPASSLHIAVTIARNSDGQGRNLGIYATANRCF